jgi:hypothetical protein
MYTDVLMSAVSAFKAAVASQQRVAEAQARAAASADRNLGNLLSALRATVTAATGKPLRPGIFWATTGCRYGKSCAKQHAWSSRHSNTVILRHWIIAQGVQREMEAHRNRVHRQQQISENTSPLTAAALLLLLALNTTRGGPRCTDIDTYRQRQ